MSAVEIKHDAERTGSYVSVTMTMNGSITKKQLIIQEVTIECWKGRG